MENNIKNISGNNSDNEESKKIVNNFKNELEKLKQKLSKDFYKYSQKENKKPNNINFHYINNNINEPNKNENNYNELKEDIKIATENIENIINKTEAKEEKISNSTKPNSNNSILVKIPSLDELKMKYGINFNNKPNSIKEITIETNLNKFNKNKENKENKENKLNIQKNVITEKNNLNKIQSIEDNNSIGYKPSYNEKNENKQKYLNTEIDNNTNNINNINIFNKKDEFKNFNNNNTNNNNDENKKYDYINLLNLKKSTEEEISNIIKKREILDLSDNNDSIKDLDIDNSKEEEIKLEEPEKKGQEKEIIKKDDEEKNELEMINKFMEDDKIINNNNNNNINLSMFKNNINFNNDNNISYFSNISNINNINNINNNNIESQRQLMIGKLDNNELNDIKNIKNLKYIKDINKEINKNNYDNNNIICKTNINDNDNDNNIDLEKENKNNLITNESPIKTGIGMNNNNNSIVDTSMLNSKLEQQIKLINEKSENNRIEEEKNLLKLKEIENSLKFDKRIKHENREIRKNAIKELCEICTNFNSDEEEKEKVFECCSQWIKDCLEETNSYVIPESLNFFIIFNSLFPTFLSSSMKDFYDNIERYVNFGISSINENCFKIIFLTFQDKKLYIQSLNEIFKLLNTSYIKMAKFLNSLLITMIENNIISENNIKILFEKLINIYIKMGKKVNEKKKIYSKLLIYIYNNIEDDYNCLKNNIKLSSYKELDTLFIKIKKNKKKYKYRFYPEYQDIENNPTTVNNNNNIYNDKKKGNKTPERKNNNGSKEKDNLNNLILYNNNNNDVNDIISVLPNEFFDYHSLTQFQKKINLLENANNILNKIKNIKDKEKNLVDVYKTINYSIEDSNILIHLEGIKLLENICRLVKNFINIQKLKLLLETSFDKLKDKKSLVKNELFTLFNMIIENHCFEIDKFILFILQFCTNQKKENTQVKMGLLEYIKLLLNHKRNQYLLLFF